MSILERDLTAKPEETLPKEGTAKGLSSSQVQQRREQYGRNELESKRKIHPMRIFINQYKDILTMILLVSTVVSVLLGEYVEAFVIALIVLLNGIMGFLQEYHTEQTLEKLKQMAAPMTKVYRNGHLTMLPAVELVPDDVIEIEAGDRVPADAVLLNTASLSANEAILTGESNHQSKQNGDTVFMGTTVTTGHGEARVSAIAMKTEMGKIAHLLHEVEEPPTQLQQRLKQLGKVVAFGCLGICFLVSMIGLLRGEELLTMLLTGVSLAVAAVPEGLPAVVTVSLALAVGRMVKQNALIRKLHAVETLGCTNVICSDKTGTLTQNRMSVVAGYTVEGTVDCTKKITIKTSHPLHEVLFCGAVCNNARLEEKSGDSTELALLQCAEQYGVHTDGVRIAEVPFDSRTKQMAVTLRFSNGKTVRYLKGAPDVLLAGCSQVLEQGETRAMSTARRQQIKQVNDRMAANALRVLGFAKEESDGKICFLGLLGMMDPPRPEVPRAIAECRQAGIKTVMITGDHLLTAKAVAEQIGIYHEGDQVLEGKLLDGMDEKTLEETVKRTTVYARVTPKHKLIIVAALQKCGNVVAMTGDGVNDAPAVKKADIGVSMGITGTDVTKEAADITLLDDNFATLVYAIKEGRVIYTNIRKFIRYLLSCNIGEVLTMFVGLLMGMPLVLLPIHILTINLITDGLPAICLGLEPAEPSVMRKKPRGKNESIFADGLMSEILFRGLFIGFATLAAFVLTNNLTGELVMAQTAAYFTLVTTQLVNVFACKATDGKWSFARLGNNPKLLWSAVLSAVVLGLTIYCTPIALFFGTAPLSGQVLLICAVCTILPSITGMILHGHSKSRREQKKLLKNLPEISA